MKVTIDLDQFDFTNDDYVECKDCEVTLYTYGVENWIPLLANHECKLSLEQRVEALEKEALGRVQHNYKWTSPYGSGGVYY